MEETKLICVLNFEHDAFSELYRLKQDEMLCDISLRIGEELVKAHRIVLAATSPYFHAMFTGDMLESRQTEVALHGVEFHSLEQLINYCYSGKIEITIKNAQNLLATANLLQLVQVEEACVNFFQERLHPNNCLGILNFADAFSCISLSQAADEFTVKNFKHVVDSDEFLSLPYEQISRLLIREDLNIRSEEQIFEAVMKWVKKDEEDRKVFLPNLLKNVRLALLSPQYLCDKVCNDELIRNSLICRDLIDEVKNYFLLPERRNDFTGVFAKPRKCSEASGAIYAVGGLTQSGEPLSTVEKFDLLNLEWQSCKSMLTLRTRVGVAVLDNKLYALGGYDGNDRLSTVEFFDAEENIWCRTSSMNTRRSALGASALNGNIFVSGGYDGHISLHTVEFFNPDSKQWRFTSPMTTLRSAAGMVSLGGKLYVTGGHNGLQIFNSVECFDPQLNTWTCMQGMKTRRCRVGVVVMDGCLYACGGYDGSSFLDSLERYCPRTGSWSMLAPMSSRRSRVALTTLGGSLYAIGGYDGMSNLNSMERYDPKAEQWFPAPSMYLHEGGVGVGVLPCI
ncbi:kelch-like protein 18 [Xenia sp. Carnegie-2017]|uniref:kelch-like protein 18 n=1 Tax=Xenia sp. Carnegie-2017 TaxID=2897299 RepID=UPI001F03FFA2|nr:kelch-like protein 18 [Xenia sp. Carnegie-2017]